MFKKLKEMSETIDNLYSRVNSLEYRLIELATNYSNTNKEIKSLRESIEKLSERAETHADNEANKKEKILNDIKAIQDYSLDDALNYLKGE